MVTGHFAFIFPWVAEGGGIWEVIINGEPADTSGWGYAEWVALASVSPAVECVFRERTFRMVSGPSASWHGVNTGSMDVAFVLPNFFDWSPISVGPAAEATLWVVNVGSVTAKDWVTGAAAETVRDLETNESGEIGKLVTRIRRSISVHAFINPIDAPVWPSEKPLWTLKHPDDSVEPIGATGESFFKHQLPEEPGDYVITVQSSPLLGIWLLLLKPPKPVIELGIFPARKDAPNQHGVTSTAKVEMMDMIQWKIKDRLVNDWANEEFKWERKRVGAETWETFAPVDDAWAITERELYVPGYFVYRVTAVRDNVQSDEFELEVQFPSYETLKANEQVQTQMMKDWIETSGKLKAGAVVQQIPSPNNPAGRSPQFARNRDADKWFADLVTQGKLEQVPDYRERGGYIYIIIKDGKPRIEVVPEDKPGPAGWSMGFNPPQPDTETRFLVGEYHCHRTIIPFKKPPKSDDTHYEAEWGGNSARWPDKEPSGADHDGARINGVPGIVRDRKSEELIQSGYEDHHYGKHEQPILRRATPGPVPPN